MLPLRRLSQIALRSHINKINSSPIPSRALSITSVCHLKKMIRQEEGDQITIEAEYIPSPREKHLVKFEKQNLPSTDEQPGQCSCCLCNLGLHIKHTDVLILSQFTNSRGKQLPRAVTGLCKPQHKRMDYLLVMAEKAGLMSVYSKEGVKRELPGWEVGGFNKYYDEGFIDEFINRTTRRFRA